MGVYSWTAARFKNLCKLSRRTPQELCDMFCITRQAINKYLEKDDFPGTVGLHLSNFESFITHKPLPIVNPSHGS